PLSPKPSSTTSPFIIEGSERRNRLVGCDKGTAGSYTTSTPTFTVISLDLRRSLDGDILVDSPDHGFERHLLRLSL
ncbi:hypothetical protein V5O48_005160, partial [Marasmius crinis-equi]